MWIRWKLIPCWVTGDPSSVDRFPAKRHREAAMMVGYQVQTATERGLIDEGEGILLSPHVTI